MPGDVDAAAFACTLRSPISGGGTGLSGDAVSTTDYHTAGEPFRIVADPTPPAVGRCGDGHRNLVAVNQKLGEFVQAKSASVMPSAWPAGHWTSSIR
jgi:hypothetical protein